MARRRRRSHSAEVTADRLRYALDKWPDAWEQQERDYIGMIIHRLECIASGQEAEHG